MPTESVALGDLLRKAGVGQAEFLRVALEEMLQGLMEGDVDAQVGAQRYERAAERATYRNGHRDRDWNTRLGPIPERERERPNVAPALCCLPRGQGA